MPLFVCSSASVLNRLICAARSLLERGHRVGVSSEQVIRRESLDTFQRSDVDRQFLIQSSALAERQRWLREQLRRFPFWARGHLELGSAALQDDDVATAYASAVAALKLAPGGHGAVRASAVLGRAYLRRGEGERAVEMFERCVPHAPGDVGLREDLAAAYLLVGNAVAALEALEAIPLERRSAEALAALAYARKQTQTESK